MAHNAAPDLVTNDSGSVAVHVEERELWAWCGPCNRWFFVPKTDAPVPELVMCPVCAEHPGQFEGRDPQGQAPAIPR